MKKQFWSSDKIVSLSAILISLMTLAVLSYQTSLMRKQQRLSVLPYLSIGNYGTNTPNYKFVLENSGIGPAFIESIKIFYKGKVYKKDFAQFLISDIPEMDSVNNVYHSNIYEGVLIPSGRKINLLQIDNSLEDALKFNKVLEMLYKNGFGFELVYRSAYDEKWKITHESSIPVKIGE